MDAPRRELSERDAETSVHSNSDGTSGSHAIRSRHLALIAKIDDEYQPFYFIGRLLHWHPEIKRLP
jgi:hypothetical protein